MIAYFRLWDMLNRKGIKKTELLDTVSSPTLAKLGKNEYVSTETIEKLCRRLSCQPCDIMEFIDK